MKSKHLTTLLLTCFTCICFSQENYIYDLQEIAASAYSFQERNQINKAIEELDKIHFLDPAYLVGITSKVEFLESAERYEEIIELLLPLLEKGSFNDYPPLYYNLSKAYSSLEKYDEALAVLDEGKANFPNYSLLYFYSGVSNYEAGKTQAAVNDFKQTIILNPGLSRAHYLLGAIALDKGELIPGFLSIVGYLALSPGDNLATTAVSLLDKDFSSNYKDLAGIVFSKEGDDFSELIEILRNNLPLNKKFKLKSSVDYNYTRYLQAVIEYAESHEIQDGFFETHYIPFLKEIGKQDLTELFTYYTLVSFEEGKLGKTVQKNMNDLLDFQEEFIEDEFQDLFYVTPMVVDGESKMITIEYNEGDPFIKGEVIDGKKQGTFIYMDEYGRKRGTYQYVDDKLEGEAILNDIEGVIDEKAMYINDEKNGRNVGINSKGEETWVINFKDGKLDGDYSYIYALGGVNCKEPYIDGKLIGEVNCNYANGQKRATILYNENEERDGIVTYYGLNGEKSYEYTYKNGKITGPVHVYKPDGNLQFSYEMKDDEYVFPYTLYNSKGEVTEKGEMENGDKKITYSNENGEHSIYRFDGDELKSLESYEDDKLLYTFTFKNDALQSITSHLGEKPKKLKKSPITYYDADGNKRSERSYKKLTLDGKSTYYYRNGQILSVEEYANGEQTGEDIAYDYNGDISSIANYKNDTLNGIFKSYESGHLAYTCYYADGKLNGPLNFYRTTGEISETRFYSDGKMVASELYDASGKLYEKNTFNTGVGYEYGELSESLHFYKGKKIDSIDFYYKDGLFKTSMYGLESIDRTLKNGMLEGLTTYRFREDKVESTCAYVNGKKHGVLKRFAPSGAVKLEMNYVYGESEGKSIWYDDMGNKTAEGFYQKDQYTGKSKVYYPDGSVYRTAMNKNDQQEGPKIFFSPSGDTLLILHMKADLIDSYQVRTAEGTMSNSSALPKGKKTVNITYEDGQPAMNISFDKLYIDGKLQIYSREGVLILEKNRKKGYLDGPYVKYHANGEKYLVQTYNQHNLQDDIAYYDENGVIQLRIGYKDDRYHGAYKIYENGELKETMYFEYGKCVPSEE